MRKFFATVLAVMSVLTATLVGAAVQMFDGEGKYIMSDFEDPTIAEQRAIQRAKENAQDKAGVYLTSFSKSENALLTVDEISAVTNNIIEVSDVDVQAEPFEVKGETGIIYTVGSRRKSTPTASTPILSATKRIKLQSFSRTTPCGTPLPKTISTSRT